MTFKFANSCTYIQLLRFYILVHTVAICNELMSTCIYCIAIYKYILFCALLVHSYVACVFVEFLHNCGIVIFIMSHVYCIHDGELVLYHMRRRCVSVWHSYACSHPQTHPHTYIDVHM